MKNLLKILLLASLSFTIASTFTATAGDISVGIFGGKTDIDNDCDFSAIGPSQCTPEIDDQAYGINLGYTFSDFLGVEVGYADLGELRFDFGFDGNLFAEIDLSPSVTYGAAVGSAAFNERLSLSGRVGYYELEADTFDGLYAISVPSGFRTDTISDSDIYLGASLDYSLTEDFSAQLRYDDFGIGVFSFGLKYAFEL